MKHKVEPSVMVVAATTVAALFIVGAIFWRQRKKQQPQKRPLKEIEIPTKWTKIGEVRELIMYPLKGAKRKCVTEAECTQLGLRELASNKLALQDRVFIVYDNNDKFLNAKKNSKMLFLETTAIDESTVKFSFPDTEDITVKIPNDNSTRLNKIDFYYGEMVGTVDCGEEAAEWFSQRLLNAPTGLHLGCFVKSLIPPRTIDGAYDTHAKVYNKFHSDYLGAFADIASYMLMSEESVNDLNRHLDKPVSEHNFRPNIVVKGSPAYSEDSWDWVRLGDQVVLRSFKYCSRCVVTAINPDTAELDPKFEPLQTLRKYRQVKEPELKKLEGSSPVMGLYAGCHRTGTVRVGDPVFISAEAPLSVSA